MKQKAAFQEILDAKNSLIKRFQEDLRKKDEDYRNMLNKQREDIDEILLKMRKQFRELREMYLSELNEIENEFENDVFFPHKNVTLVRERK
jgi:hypothetical protein